jgi:hypothetical protein
MTPFIASFRVFVRRDSLGALTNIAAPEPARLVHSGPTYADRELYPKLAGWGRRITRITCWYVR